MIILIQKCRRFEVNKAYYWIFIIFLLAPATDINALQPSGKYFHRNLICPRVEGALLLGQPGVVIKQTNGRLIAECEYFVKTGTNTWTSALVVKAHWVEDPAAKPFNCKWEGRKDPFRHRISRRSQAWTEVSSYDHDRYDDSFDVLLNLFNQVEGVALECPNAAALTRDEDAATIQNTTNAVAKGKVTMVRGKEVTIRLESGQSKVVVGAIVELSYTVDDDVLPVGTWRITAVKGDGTVEAGPVKPLVAPSINLDAVILDRTEAFKK